MPKQLYLLIFLCFLAISSAAQVLHGTVTDTTGKPLAFATIKLGDSKQGLMADLNGRFTIKRPVSFSFIHISHLGYKTRKIDLDSIRNGDSIIIVLEAAPANLEEVVIKSSTSKLKRIINTAIANRNRNNPEKYDWYQCNVYYKTVVDLLLPDSSKARDTSQSMRRLKQFTDSQHMFITETYSRRTWERPQKLQEDVMAARISGFKKAWFASLVTDVLPFHSYNDFLQMNGKDYHNPLSGGAFNRFYFKIEDEIMQGNDTVWVISFRPLRDKENLSGTLFINSHQFAIGHLLAQHHDSSINRTVGIEQQYRLIEGKWFPEQLNYFISWKNLMGSNQSLYMKGSSLIDSVSFSKTAGFRFDKAHTARLKPGADELPDSAWSAVRPSPLAEKERRTYVFMDSLGRKYNFDRIPLLAEKLAYGFYPAGYIDIDIQRLYSYNRYEKHRLGFGFRTSEKISKHFSVGAWFGYGTGDKNLKYGTWAEFYADKYREFTFRFDYKNDLQDPGRLQINKELDRNFLRRFLLYRVDKVRSYSFEVNKRLGYWQTGVGFNAEEITPQYNYILSHSGKTFTNFKTKEVVVNLRYAYAERMSPLLGRYYSSGTKYPVFYSKIRFGKTDNDNNRYIHGVAAVKWQKHINRIGNEQFLLMAGGVWSKHPMPLSKLFAGNGFQVDRSSFYVFGGMQTMLPYQYYSDKFINFYWKHDFDFKFFNAKITRGLSTSPSLSLGYNVLWGKLSDANAHQQVQFSVPDPAYHEAGAMLNRLVRLKFMGLYYLNFNAGYYYHLDGKFDHKKNGRFVFGLGIDL